MPHGNGVKPSQKRHYLGPDRRVCRFGRSLGSGCALSHRSGGRKGSILATLHVSSSPLSASKTSCAPVALPLMKTSCGVSHQQMEAPKANVRYLAKAESVIPIDDESILGVNEELSGQSTTILPKTGCYRCVAIMQIHCSGSSFELLYRPPKFIAICGPSWP